MKNLLALSALTLLLGASSFSADNLKLNQRLNYSSDSLDGPLISSDNPTAGALAGKPNYVIIYGEGCFNSKRQAKRTVELYEKYKGRVNFVVVDLDQKRSDAQQQLVKKFYQGSIPHVVVLNSNGDAVYNSAGEVPSEKISAILDKALQ